MKKNAENINNEPHKDAEPNEALVEENINNEPHKDTEPNEALAEENINNEPNEVPVEEKLRLVEEKLLRSLAETENQRRRFEREIKDAFEFGGFNFARENLAILDNLQRAKISIKNDESLKDNPDLEKFLKNFEIIEKDLLSIFEKNKIKKINCIKEKFDPNFHQAMLEIEDDLEEPGTIMQEIQPGYKFGERLLRPSFVGVSKKKTKENDKNEDT
jgi:molecular chaperone GrpE